MYKPLLALSVIALIIIVAANYFDVDLRLTTNNEKSRGVTHFANAHINKPLPDFSLKDISGQLLSSQDLRGKRVHINFWSTSCKPCLEEFAELNRLTNHYTEQYVFLALAPEDSAQVSRTLRKHPLAYRVIPNAGPYFARVGVEAYPKNFFVDSQGIIRLVVEGSQKSLDSESLTLASENYAFFRKILDALD